jgi:hypothetical protein
MQPVLGGVVLREQVDRPAQGVGRGLMPGHEERQELVAQLPLVHVHV